jgi:hypothetical protein
MMLLLLAAGCTCGRDVRHAKPVAVVDNIPQDGQKGYVEFVSTHHNAPFPIFLIDDPARPELLGAIGLNHDDKYSYSRHDTEMAEKLRVALPPGDHIFTIEREGEALKVPVVDGQVTPVEIDYVLLDSGDVFAVYRIGNRVLSPAAKQTAMVRSAPSK